MTVSMEQLQRGITSYYESEFCQKSSGVDKFAAYFMLPSIPGIVAKKIDQFRNTPFAEGLINPDGLVDVDAVRERANTAMQHCGSLELMGFRLDTADVDKIYDFIRRA